MKKLEEIKNLVSNAENNLFIAEKNIEKLKERIKILEKEASEQKESEQEQWPRVGDKVTIVNLLGETATQIYLHTPFFEHQLKIGNCHRTEEQALRHKEYITSPRVRARELVERCEGFNILGEYLINITKAGTVGRVVSEYITGGIRFDCPEACDNAIKEHYKLIKVALGVIVGEEAERIVREYVGRGE